MNKLETGGWDITNAVVGRVNPSSFDLIVPVGARSGLCLSVPVSAVRDSSCLVEYIRERYTLTVTCGHAQELARYKGAVAKWDIAPWGATNASCVVTRNFAQPVKHHASMNAIIVSDVTFNATVGAGPERVQLTLRTGHRMYPEVFSAWPDLEKWHLVDRDITAYAHIWYDIRLCQTHSAASSSALYTPRSKMKVDWFADGKGRETCQIKAEEVQILYGDRMVDLDDLAIIHCSTRHGNTRHGEAVFYGTVRSKERAGAQRQTRRCTKNGCDGTKCSFAHSDTQMRGLRFDIRVELSKISHEAKKLQQDLMNGATDVDFDVQFINVPMADRRSLDSLLNLPRFARNAGASPVLNFLTSCKAPDQKKGQEEMRPLANTEQVARAIASPHFRVDDSGLNDLQMKGVKRGLQRPFSVVQGPPGTGKTTFLVHLAIAVLNLETDPSLELWNQVREKRKAPTSQDEKWGRILICTPSNQAADEVMSRLMKNSTIPHNYVVRIYARSIESAHGSQYKRGMHIDSRESFKIKSGLEEHSLHFKTRNRPEMRQRHHQMVNDGQHQTRTQCEDYDKAYSREEEMVLKDARIVVTTCTSACSHSSLVKGLSSERSVRFSTAIIDEAAQATEPDVLLTALLADQRVVLVGDHKQLGPVVLEGNLCRAFMGALETPMLERLYRTPELLPANTMLNRQYRMHGSIRSFPSKQFYHSRLEDDASMIKVASMHGSIWPVAEEHAVFIDCAHPHAIGSVTNVGAGRSRSTATIENNTSLFNEGEAELVALACQRLLKQVGCRPDQIGVITPYRAQKDTIEEKLKNKCGAANARDVAVGTVYSLQGSERDYIVLSFVRSVAEGHALCQNAHLTSATDVVVSPQKQNAALRQICESHLGIVSNCKLLNVSLTRAKHGLVIVGNRNVLAEGSEDFLALIEHMQERRCCIPEGDFRTMTGKAPVPTQAPTAPPQIQVPSSQPLAPQHPPFKQAAQSSSAAASS